MDDAAPASTIGRKLTILMLVLAVVVIGWTGGWFWLKGEVARRMDDQISRLDGRGLIVRCLDRTVSGWPFRIDIDCSDPSLTQKAGSAALSFNHLRVTTLVYNPTLVIAELDGPLQVTGQTGETASVTWTQLRASLGLTLLPTPKPGRLAIAGDGLVANVMRPGSPEAKLEATHVELHARQSPDAASGSNDVDLVVTLSAAKLSVANHSLGPEIADYGLDSVARGLPSERGEGGFMKAWLGSGGSLVVRKGRMSVGGFSIDASGPVTANVDGSVNAPLKLIASGFATLMQPPAATMKGRNELMGLATVFTLFGKSVPEADGIPAGSRSVDLTIEQGRIKFGPTGVGHLPPVF